MTEAAAPTNVFQDLAGREWKLAIDFDALRRVNDQTNVDLGDLEKLGVTSANLVTNNMKALDVVWALVSPKAKLDGLERPSWEASMDGGTLDAALTALGAGVVLFTPPRKRGPVTQTIDAIQTGVTKTFEKIDQMMTAKLNEKINEALEMSGISKLDAPESSEPSTAAGP